MERTLKRVEECVCAIKALLKTACLTSKEKKVLQAVLEDFHEISQELKKVRVDKQLSLPIDFIDRKVGLIALKLALTSDCFKLNS